MDDFLIRALIAAIGIAFMAAPLGCFVVWQRLSYFGDTIAHSALLGIAFGLMFNMNLTLSVFLFTLFVALSLFFLQTQEKISSDSILGVLAHSALAIGLILLGFMQWVRVDLMSYLFGDILAVSQQDLITIWSGCLLSWGLLALLWRPLLTLTVSADLAEAEKLYPTYTRFVFMISLALVIALTMKIIGILMTTALLVIPAAVARIFSKTPEQMAVFAALIGAANCVLGLFGSYYLDTRSGASIVVALFLTFCFTRLFFYLWQNCVKHRCKERRR